LNKVCTENVQHLAFLVRTARTIPHCSVSRWAHSCSLEGKRANTEVDFREPKAQFCSARIMNVRKVPN